MSGLPFGDGFNIPGRLWVVAPEQAVTLPALEAQLGPAHALRETQTLVAIEVYLFAGQR